MTIVEKLFKEHILELDKPCTELCSCPLVRTSYVISRARTRGECRAPHTITEFLRIFKFFELLRVIQKLLRIPSKALGLLQGPSKCGLTDITGYVP